MKVNEHTAISTPTLLLVPYSPHHVPTYHKWMQDPDLQAATASEPLTLDEEYAMQQSWRTDRDKLTFIICQPSENLRAESVSAGEDDRSERMVGDINLFLFHSESEEFEEGLSDSTPGCVGEVELMIAEKKLQRKGYGRAALLMFTDYVLSNWPSIAKEWTSKGNGKGEAMELECLRVKINHANVGSIRLFESVGYVKTAEEANFFGEVELRWAPSLKVLRAQKGWEKAIQMRYL